MLTAEQVMDRIIELEKEFLKMRALNPRGWNTKATFETYRLNIRIHNRMVGKLRWYHGIRFGGDSDRETLEE